MAGAVARDAHNVIFIDDAVDQGGIFVNDGHAVALTGYVLNERVTDLTVSYNDDIHVRYAPFIINSNVYHTTSCDRVQGLLLIFGTMTKMTKKGRDVPT
jgi:hypothetical protein